MMFRTGTQDIRVWVGLGANWPWLYWNIHHATGTPLFTVQSFVDPVARIDLLQGNGGGALLYKADTFGSRHGNGHKFCQWVQRLH